MKVLQTSGAPRITATGIDLALQDGGLFSVQALSANMFRVRVKPKDGYKEPRTWAIAPVQKADISTVADTPWSGRNRDDLDGFNPPAVTHSHDANSVTVKTSVLCLRLSQTALKLEWQTAHGQPVATDRATSSYFSSQRTGAVRHYLERNRAEHYYGLGDKTGPLDLHGRRLRTQGLDALGYDPKTGDPLYKHWPFVLTRAANGLWYGVYYDTMATCTFDLGCEHDNYHEPYRYVEIDDGDLDYYFMTGNSPAEVIAQFMKLIGGTHLPPRWSLGFAQTAMGLADAPDAQVQLDGFIERIAAEGVPISSFHYGSGYSSRGKRRYVFTWNKAKFPDPKALNSKFQKAGMRLVANIKPCLLDDHPAYDQVKLQGGFIHDRQSGQPVVEQFWDGVGAHLDFTNPAAIAWWQQGLKTQLLDFGIDVGWNDNNEYSVMDDAATCIGFGQAMPMHRSRSAHPLLMTRATFEAQQQHLNEKSSHEQPFTVTRGGMPGIQRYAQTWSGDNTTSWETLRWNIRTGLQMSLSGMFNTGHDVGGFAGPSPEPELFVRWVQACSLNPRMVMNSWKLDGTINLPWMHESVKAEVISAIALRYQLMPYLWSLFERATANFEPIIRPTFYDFPDDEACYLDSDDFMLGHALLVAPVVDKGALEKSVYLPETKQRWYDFYTHQPMAAGQWHTVAAPLGRLPLFVRGETHVPMAAPLAGATAKYDGPVSSVLSF